MKKPHEHELEEWARRELATLPLKKAPADLLSRVRTAVALQVSLPWWQQSWFAWPRMAQITSAVLAGMVVIGVVGLVSFDWMSIASEIHWFQQAQTTVTLFLGVVATLAGMLAESLGLPVSGLMIFAAVLGGFCYLGCLGLGTIFYRFTVRCL